MNPALVAVIAAIVTGAPFTVWLTFRKDRRQAPIETRAAVAADVLSAAQAADLLVGQAIKISQSASEQLADLKADMASRFAALENDMATVKRELAAERAFTHVLVTTWRQNWPATAIPPRPEVV